MACFIPLIIDYFTYECSSNEDRSNTAEETKESTKHKNGLDVLSESQSDEAKREAQISASIHDFAADKLTKWCENERCNGADKVEEEES